MTTVIVEEETTVEIENRFPLVIEIGGTFGGHPNLAAHESLGLASNDDIDAHAAASDPHGDRAYSDTHLGDAEDAHDASAISLETVVGLDATDVQAAFEEIIFEGTTGNTEEHEAADDPHPGYQLEAAKSQPDGYASLDGTGVVPVAELPAPPSVDAHDASAIAFAPIGSIASTDVQSAIEEVGAPALYKSGVGVTIVADADFPETPADGTIAVAYDTFASRRYLCFRANGAWASVEGTA